MKSYPPKDLPGFLWYFLKPHKYLAILLVFTGLLYGIITVATSYMLKLIIDGITAHGNLGGDIIDYIVFPSTVYICLFVFEMSNYRIADYLKLRMFPAIRKDIISYSFQRLLKQSYSYFQNSFAGKISNKVNDLNSSVIAVLSKCDELFATASKLFIAIIVLGSLNVYYICVLVLWCLAIYLVTSFYAKKVFILSKDFSASRSVLMGSIVDSFSNIINILTFNNRSYEKQRNTSYINTTVDKDRRMQKSLLFMRIFQDLTFIFLMLGFLLLSIQLYQTSQITVGSFILALNLAVSVSQNIWWVANTFTDFSEDIGKCAQAVEIINTPIIVKNKKNAKKFKITKGDINFEDVTFSYGENHLFKNKQVKIKAGEKVGLVGFTGSGKSSFIYLIMRFYDPASGRINIDGVDISDMRLSSLRSQISMIPQDTTLFHRTIEENIKYGNIDASYDESLEAAKKAYCDEFINELPEKYKTLVGERGVKLSGGQRQRIAIARAFLKDAPIVIMDEATSALDSITEKKIQNSLKKLTRGKTTIIIAHRLSTLADMDRILVFDNGSIVQDGSHLQLVRAKGHYRKLWRMQADGFIPQQEED